MIFILFQWKTDSKKNCLPTGPYKYSYVSGNKTFFFALNNSSYP